MLPFPQIDPVIFSIGPLHVRWYGLMYVLGFTASYFLVQYQIREQKYQKLEAHFENINLTLIIAVILGGRLGYVLFYNLPYFLKNPQEIVATWHGGMSFHGACVGVLLSGFFYCRIKKLDFWRSADIYVATIPIGLGLGRIGNFINGELYGRTTDAWWGMIFPYGGPLPRHPSQLYEAFLEGIVLFILLWSLRKLVHQKQSKNFPNGSIVALFLIGYGFMRTFVEFFREPDHHIGFLFGSVTMGQLLSSIMIVCGVLIWVLLRTRTST